MLKVSLAIALRSGNLDLCQQRHLHGDDIARFPVIRSIEGILVWRFADRRTNPGGPGHVDEIDIGYVFGDRLLRLGIGVVITTEL